MAEPRAQWVTAAPAPALAEVVTGYIGYDLRGFPPGVHTGLPSTSLALNISLDEPIDVEAPGGRARYAAPLGGLHAHPVAIHHDGTQHGVSVGISPLGARALLGMPAAPLGGAVVELAEVVRGTTVLCERLAAAATWAQRFALVDAHLTAALGTRSAPHPEITYAWHLIQHGAPGLRVHTVAAEVGWSRRHLSARFRAEVGLTPTQALRIARFQRTIGLLRRMSLADAATVGGYADQPHLNREFRALAGCTPTAWLAEEFPDVQDSAAPSR